MNFLKIKTNDFIIKKYKLFDSKKFIHFCKKIIYNNKSIFILWSDIKSILIYLKYH